MCFKIGSKYQSCLTSSDWTESYPEARKPKSVPFIHCDFLWNRSTLTARNLQTLWLLATSINSYSKSGPICEQKPCSIWKPFPDIRNTLAWILVSGEAFTESLGPTRGTWLLTGCETQQEETGFTSSMSRFCVPSSLSPVSMTSHECSRPWLCTHLGNKARRTTPHERNRRMTEGVWMCLALRPNRFSSLCCMQIGTMKKWAANLIQDRLWLKTTTRPSNTSSERHQCCYLGKESWEV